MSRYSLLWLPLSAVVLSTLSGCGFTIMAGPGGVSSYERTAYSAPPPRTVVVHRYEERVPAQPVAAPAPAPAPARPYRPGRVVVGRVDRPAPVVVAPRPTPAPASGPRIVIPASRTVKAPTRVVTRPAPAAPARGTTVIGGGTFQDRYSRSKAPNRVD